MVIKSEPEYERAVKEEGDLEDYVIRETYKGKEVSETVYQRIAELDMAIQEYLK